MQIVIINGPNLNLLGKREPDIYGSQSFEDYFNQLQTAFPKVELTYFQSNHEGEIIDKLHEYGFKNCGIILNPGGLTHTSVALGDAVAGIQAPVLEVHISNIFAREPFRHKSFVSAHAKGTLAGFGLFGYHLAIQALIQS